MGEKRIAGPCPALTKKPDGSFGCGIVLNPTKWVGKSKYRPEVISRNMMQCIGAGTGCDEIGYDEGDSVEEEKLEQMIEKTKADPEWIKETTKAINILMNLKK